MKIKQLLIVVFSLLFILLVGCENTTISNSTTVNSTEESTVSSTKGIVTTTNEGETWVLPDMTGFSTEQVRKTLEDSPLENWNIIVKGDLEYGSEEGQYQFEKFYGYAGANNVPGATVQSSKKLNVYVTAYNLSNSLSDFVNANQSLKKDYSSITLSGKNLSGIFTTDGIGEVTVTSFVDGDTTRFRDLGGNLITLRYLGVDTPESTAAFEPWGKAASKYTEECLTNAKKIVLEADAPGQKDSNERFLGWVWYQDQADEWHLLQLEQILFCYTKDKADSNSTYGKFVSQIGSLVQKTGRRVWGEHDPNYDYSTDPKVLTLEELRTNFSLYYSKKVTVTGVVALLDGASPVIVDPQTGYGIYFYIPPWMSTGAYDVKVGNVITITGVATYYGSADENDLDSMDIDLGEGSPQLTDFKENNVVLVESRSYLDESTKDYKVQLSTLTPTLLDASNLTSKDLGRYCKFENLTIKRVYEASTKSGFTVTCEDENGNEINIRVDDSHYFIEGSNEEGLDKKDFVVGHKIKSVTGYLTYYFGFQVGLISKALIEFDE